MKKVELSEVGEKLLLTEKQGFSVENQGKLIGFYDPVIDDEKVKIAKQELDLIMDQVLAETGLTEEEYWELFMKAGEQSWVWS